MKNSLITQKIVTKWGPETKFSFQNYSVPSRYTRTDDIRMISERYWIVKNIKIIFVVHEIKLWIIIRDLKYIFTITANYYRNSSCLYQIQNTKEINQKMARNLASSIGTKLNISFKDDRCIKLRWKVLLNGPSWHFAT